MFIKLGILRIKVSIGMLNMGKQNLFLFQSSPEDIFSFFFIEWKVGESQGNISMREAS